MAGETQGCIAQLVEQLTLNQRVEGSSPSTPTNKPLKKKKKFEAFFSPGL
jgi:hypothetical protein